MTDLSLCVVVVVLVVLIASYEDGRGRGRGRGDGCGRGRYPTQPVDRFGMSASTRANVGHSSASSNASCLCSRSSRQDGQIHGR